MDNAIAIIFQLAILIFSVVIHEVAHGLAANALGDPTAKYAGRLTLNPLKHLDPVGSFLVPLMTFVIPRFFGGSGFVIGWAKPVPYNPYNLKTANKELGSAVVGAAGPAANIIMALIFGLLLRLVAAFPAAFGYGILPLEGFIRMASAIVFINLALAVFNLVPIPPLDGSKVLFSILPGGWLELRAFIERFGFVLLLIFIFYFSNVIFSIALALFQIIAGSDFLLLL